MDITIVKRLKKTRYAILAGMTILAVSVPLNANAQSSGGLFGKPTEALTDSLTIDGVSSPLISNVPKFVFGMISMFMLVAVAFFVAQGIKEAGERNGQSDWTGPLTGLMITILGFFVIQVASNALFGA